MVLVQTNSTQSAKICPNLHFFDGRGSGCWSRPTKPTSAKICPNLHFQGEWGGLDQLNPKCQNLSKSAFLRGEGMPRSVQIFIFRGGVGGWWSRPTQPKVPRSVQICMGGGGGTDQYSWNTWVGALKEFWTKISTTGTSYCITDSLSYTSVWRLIIIIRWHFFLKRSQVVLVMVP